MTRTRGVRALVATGVLAVGLVVSSCGGDDDTVTLDKDGASVKGDASSGKFEIETPEGKVKVDASGGTVVVETPAGNVSSSYGTDGKLPETFPRDFPMPDGLTVVSQSTQSEGDDKGWVVNTQTKDGKAAYDFFVSNLPKKGYSIANKTSGTQDGNFYAAINFERDGKEGSVSIAQESDERTAVIIILEG